MLKTFFRMILLFSPALSIPEQFDIKRKVHKIKLRESCNEYSDFFNQFLKVKGREKGLHW